MEEIASRTLAAGAARKVWTAQAKKSTEGASVKTTDKDYADLLARLNAIPAQQPQRREQTRQQERAHLVEDLLSECGEATW